jgi:hypothetical protein
MEFGTQNSGGTHARTVEQFGRLLRTLRIEGGVYWQWVNPTNDPRWSYPGTDLKKRGLAFAYNPQAAELADLFGFHLRAIPNGSFEQGLRSWKIAGRGASRIDVRKETAGTPWRGRYALRLASRDTGTLSATGPRIRVTPGTT